MVILVILCLGMALGFGYLFNTIAFWYLVLNMYDKISLILPL